VLSSVLTVANLAAAAQASAAPRAREEPPNPWFSWHYVESNWADIESALSQHIWLTLEALVVSFVLALPLAVLARAWPRLAGPVLGTSAVLYTIPSLALFGVLAPITGIGRTTVLIGLVAYSLLLLVRNTLVGLRGVDADVTDAARGLGYGRLRLLFAVELPAATPTIVAGLRLAAVSTVGLVTVGVVVGYGGLGQLMFRGFRSHYRAEVMTATLLCVALAFVLDVAIMLTGRRLTPWTRAREAR
jgi:osmoprotectant transport system permease protein